MEAINYWNEIGSKKNFEDPIYLEKIKQYYSKSVNILEYGCGYGRLMNILKEAGYNNVIGFDYSKKMIERGKKEHPHLNINFLENAPMIPLKKESVDLVVLSTILCSLVDIDEQVNLIDEMTRVLKPGGSIYVSDFMINKDKAFLDKYQKGFEKFGEWGVYTTSEDLTVRHHSTNWIMDLFSFFDILWFEQFDFKTMNNNPARTFHMLAQKINS